MQLIVNLFPDFLQTKDILYVYSVTKEKWIADEVGEYIRNDRFVCEQKPQAVEITIRKTYRIEL